MPITRVWTCDLPGCTETATSLDDHPPPGWWQLVSNEAGISTVTLHSRADLVTWTGATSVPREITYAQALPVVRAWRKEHGKNALT